MIKLKHIVLGMVALLLLGMVGCILLFSSSGDKIPTMATFDSGVIVVDAGHGFPDGGASVGDVLESDLNLMIAQKLEVALLDRGYEVVMTREDEKNIADPDKQNSLSEMKQSDLTNRVKIINESGADFCISIHMNKYTNAKYWGWQTFYNQQSEEGKKLAECIQKQMEEVIHKNNTRTALKIEGIKIVDKTCIPVVIVECGFMSNPDELALLQSKEYQEKLVEGICNGVELFYQYHS